MAERLEGFEKAQRSLRRLVPEQKKAIEDALDRGARDIESLARAIAPREAGELAQAIETRKTLDGFGGTGAVGNFVTRAGKAGGLQRFVGVFPRARGDPGWYAAWVEFGHQASGWASGGNYVPGRPFLRPAFHSLKKKVEGRVRRAVNRAVREAVRRG